jgi:glycosyltransferase involved in cell wall biosynthesis
MVELKEHLVSIIIPYYNKKNTINRSVQSVIDQTYTNWELFIVDDKSTEFYEKDPLWSSYNIKYLRNYENLGPGLSRQKGLDSTKGKFICFLDSDDYWLPTFLEESLKMHNQNRDLCATYAQSQMIDGTLRRRNSLDDAVDDIFYGVVSGVRPWATCALMWKREYLPKWKSIRTNEDALFELEAAINNPKIKMIPKVLCVIDKVAGSNTEDLIEKSKIEANRNNVILYAAQKVHLYRGQDNYLLKRIIWNRCKKLTLKQLKYKNYSLVLYNILFLFRRINWVI